jgi:hypothetical protein
VLQAYVDAYSRLDPGGVKRVHPSVNEQALTQAFSGYRSQQVQIRDERIMVTGTTAVVTCTLDTNFVPKVGAPQRVALKVTLRLQKAGGAWIIVDRR